MIRRNHPSQATKIRSFPAGPRGEHTLRSGFSLLELLVVVAIIFVLASLVAPTVVHQLRQNRVAQAAEAVRTAVAQCRVYALDSGIDYQFRYEPNGRQFVVLPTELEPDDANAGGGDSESPSYLRLSGELDEGIRLQAADDAEAGAESLEAAWFGELGNGLQLSQATWSAPIYFRFDGSADDGAFQVTTDEQFTADFNVRGLTGGVAVSRVYRKAD